MLTKAVTHDHRTINFTRKPILICISFLDSLILVFTDYSVFSKRFQECTDDGDSSTDWSEHIDYQCKEEQDRYIPIMEISSVHSIADTNDNLVS